MSLFSELKRRNVVRVAIAYGVFAWLLLQVVDFALDIIGSPNWIMQTLVVFAVLGLPCVMAFAWVFEITPEGIKRDSEVPREQSIRAQTGYRLDRLTLVVVVVLVVFLATNTTRNELDEDDRSGNEGPAAQQQGGVAPDAGAKHQADTNPTSSPPQEGYSIAVLPFVNMSSDPEQEYFSDGISEEILNVLSRIPEFKVAARTSSFQFKGQNQDIAKIADQLNVNHVLEGSVRKSGNKLRITSQLINAETGYHLWSETYDRDLDDVFAIQDEISAAIASQLEIQLTGAKALTTAQPVDLQAYELYLKGRVLVAGREEGQLLEAITVLQQSLDIAPDYAPAMATMAMAYAVLPYFSKQTLSGESRGQARAWAEKALTLDPDNDEAMSALSIVLREYDLDIDGALVLLQKALQVNPGSVSANNFLGDLYSRMGDFENALMYETRATELDPLGAVQWSDLADVYIFMGDYPTAHEVTEKALQLDPGFQNALTHLMDIYFLLGDMEAMKSTLKRIQTVGVSEAAIQDYIIQLNMAEGNKAEAEAILQRQMNEVDQGLLGPSFVAFNAVVTGDFDTAGRLLQKANEIHDGTWIYPLYVHVPEQAPDSEPWQEFWRQPGPKALAEIRRANGFNLPPFSFAAVKQ